MTSATLTGGGGASRAVRHYYRPQGSAVQIFKARDPEVLVVGPAGTGKSRACLEKLHLACVLNPGIRALIVRKTQVSLASTALDTFRKFVIKEALEVGDVSFHGGGPQDPPQYRYANGSTVTIGGMDRASRIMSSEYDFVYVQEATELTTEDWEALTTRLRNWRLPFQQLLGDCNPDTPTHWLKKRADSGAVKTITSTHEDNPQLFDQSGEMTEKGRSYIAKLDALTGVRKDRLRYGRWAAAEGVIYDGWQDKLHMIDRFDVPWEWPRYWSVDFGYTNPFVCQFWTQDPDGRLIMYREFYHTKRTVDVHARQILATVTDSRDRWLEPQPRFIVCDHDAEGRATFSGAVGVGTQPAIKKVIEGIQAVQMRMVPAGDGKPRLMLMRDSLVEKDAELDEAKKPTCTAEEVTGYVWDRSGNGGPKETPLKINDHGMDAMRYLVAQEDLGSRPRVGWVG